MVISMEEINTWSQERFIQTFGPLFEQSPWVAERAWYNRPFESVDHIFHYMEYMVHSADEELQLQLLRAHPELGARTPMTMESVEEQRSAGLSTLEDVQAERFRQLNEAYRDKFDFPFIIVVRGLTKDQIEQVMKHRLNQTREEELATALEQVCKIASLRLHQLEQNLSM